MVNLKLDHLPPNFTYTFMNYDENYCVIRIKELEDEDIALDWLKQYSDISKTTWRKARTFPNVGKVNLFKVDLRCTHFTDRRTKGERSSKHTGCEAKLQIVVKRKMRIRKRKRHKDTLDTDFSDTDPCIEDFPGIVTFKNNHNHLTSITALKYRDMDIEVKEKLCDLFRVGHGPTSALISHKIDLMIELKDHYHEVATDGKYVPSLSIVSKLYQKGFPSECYKTDNAEMYRRVEDFIDEYNQNCDGKVVFQHTNDHYFVVICTPLMLRVHKTIKHSSELVVMEASGASDLHRHRIYRLITPYTSGGLPLGVIITDKEKESVLYDALQCFNNLLKENAFHGQIQPEVFITNNDPKEINAVERAFPDSKKLLCQFNILKSMWVWLCNFKNGIDQNDRQEIYYLFKKIILTKCEMEAQQNYYTLYEVALNKNYNLLIAYIEELWNKKNLWATCYRENISIKGNITTNYSEVLFRLSNECIFDKIISFNLIQIVHFVLTKYEEYLRQRLLDFCENQNYNYLLTNMMPMCEKEEYYVVEYDSSLNIFNVESELGNIYKVDLSLRSCTCQYGLTKRLCKHATAIVLSFEEDISSSYDSDIETKQLLLHIAKEGFLRSHELPLVQQDIEKHAAVLTKLEAAASTDVNTVNSEAYEQVIEVIVDSNKDQENSDDENLNLTENEFQQLEGIFDHIRSGLRKNPSIYVPAVRKLLTLAPSEVDLVNVLYNFGNSQSAENTETELPISDCISLLSDDSRT